MALPLLASFYDLYIILLQLCIQLAVLLSLLVSLDRVLNVSKFAYTRAKARLTGRRPQEAWYFKPLPETDSLHPKVAVQLPMFNERAVCQAIIDCCCELRWPPSRLKIQVLDDSTDPVTRELVDESVADWRERGVCVEVLRRTNRQGYKAGAMKEGMDLLASEGYAYVAVFDADFKPEPDFLLRTIPYLEGNPEVGYVQSRWVFTNPAESYLTKAQELSLNYHMKCEQYTHSAARSFFNFNGTAGVWRRACIESAGGWNSRTTVEDMDLSLRAYVKGWKAIFLDDVTCLNELPASFFAYRKQQHRWTCGPIQLWSKASADIWASDVPLLRKLELVLLYFGVRKCSTHLVSLGFFCTLVPLAVYTPEVHIPTWALVHLPVLVTLSTAWFTPRGWVYSILYVLFENAMGTVKLWAVVTGLLDLQRAQEWVVTTKLGSSDRRPGTASAAVPVPSCKMYVGELAMAVFVMGAGVFGFLSGYHWGMSTYLVLQGCVFLAFGLNWVDCGGLLGGRLDEDVVLVPATAKAALGGVSPAGPATIAHRPEVKRTKTIPVIREAWGGASTPDSSESGLEGDLEDNVPRLGKTHSALARLQTPRPAAGDRSVSILEAYEQSASSPTHSSNSSGTRTPDSAFEAATALLPVAAAKLRERWESPSSSLTNIYSSNRKGRRFLGYGSDRSN